MVNHDWSRSHWLSLDLRDRIHPLPLHSDRKVLLHHFHGITHIRLLDVPSHDEKGWNQASKVVLLLLVHI